MRLRSGISVLLLTILVLGTPAKASTLLTFVIEPESQLTPEGDSAEALSGFLRIAIGDPGSASNTTFDLIALEILSSGGTEIRLDPAVASPGLGVLSPLGDFLLATVFLRITSSGVDLAIPDVMGGTDVPAGPGSVLSSSFQIDAGEFGGIVSVAIIATAVPEPASALLVLGGLATLGLAGRSRRVRS